MSIRNFLPLVLCALMAMPASAQLYGTAAIAAGNGPDLSASYGSVELGYGFGKTMAGAAFGRDLASKEHIGLYFVEIRGTQVIPLHATGPSAYVCGGIGQYLDGRWVNEFGAGLCWDSGLSVGACSFGGFGFLNVGYTLMR